jgi:hypothetical protein
MLIFIEIDITFSINKNLQPDIWYIKFKYPSELSQTSGTLQHQFPSRENKTLSVQKSNSNTVYLYINGVSSNPVEGYKTY